MIINFSIWCQQVALFFINCFMIDQPAKLWLETPATIGIIQHLCGQTQCNKLYSEEDQKVFVYCHHKNQVCKFNKRKGSFIAFCQSYSYRTNFIGIGWPVFCRPKIFFQVLPEVNLSLSLSKQNTEISPCCKNPSRFAQIFNSMEIKSRKVLIADDEPDILEILRYNLLEQGYDVVTAKMEMKRLKRPAGPCRTWWYWI